MESKVRVVSDALWNFGKQSTSIYRTYEDGMLDVRSTIATQFESTTELNRAMDQLEAAAQNWAANSIFHTNDVSAALASAAHAGWSVAQMLEGVPSAMLIAQAGSMDLTESVDMLAKMLASTKTPFSESEEFIDMWARTADMVATNIPELGEAFLRLGASAQFAESNEELFTMLAVLANVGTVGETAGTGLRNLIVRLIAPTNKAAEAMEQLGLSEEEISEAFEGLTEDSEAAYASLQQYGFSPYDENGNLKSLLDIFTELSTALDQIPTEQEQNAILSAIFPTRTLGYAKAILSAIKDGSIYSIYEAIYGDSDGYAQSKADTAMSGLTGSLETLASKWEELQRKVGESLSEDVTNVANLLSGLLDKVNGMDDDAFDAIINGLEGIVALGAGLSVVSGAMTLITTLATPAGLMAAGAILAFGGLGVAIKVLDNNLHNSFGNMALDTDMLTTHVNGISTAFDTAYGDITDFNAALTEAGTTYETALGTFSSKLTTAMITGQKLTKTDIKALNSYGDQMATALLDGITNSYASSMAMTNFLFGDGDDPDTAGTWSTLIDMDSDAYNAAKTKAEELSSDLRTALFNAFADGVITDEERDQINSIINAMSDEMAAAQSRAQAKEDYIATQERYYKASQVSLDSIDDYADQVKTEREARLAQFDADARTYRYGKQFDLDEKVASGEMTREAADALLADIDTGIAEQRNAINATYDESLVRAWDAAMSDSDWSEKWEALATGADTYLYGTNADNPFDMQTARQPYTQLTGYWGTGGMDRMGVGLISRMLNDFGGWEGLNSALSYYAKNDPDSEAAQQLLKFATMLHLEKYGASQLELSPFIPYLAPETLDDELLDQIQYIEDGGIDWKTGNALNEYYADQISQMQTEQPTPQTTPIPSIIQTTLENGEPLSNAQEELAAAFADPITQVVNIQYAYATGSSMMSSLFNSTAASGRPWGMGNLQNRAFADGGRATEPSIFGEAGAEWAIPEEHTARTAQLLAQAAQASGFTWPELATESTSGSTGSAASYTISYAPTIVAQDASGVEQKLKEDKKRFERWWRDRQLMQSVEVYA